MSFELCTTKSASDEDFERRQPTARPRDIVPRIRYGITVNRPTERSDRVVALLLGALVGCGVGHFYLGRRRRAGLWLVGLLAGLIAATALIPPLGRAIGFGWACAAPLFVLLLGWIVPLVDLFLLRAGGGPRAPAWQVVLFALGFYASMIAVPIAIRLGALEAYKIPAGSMMPTLLVGDHIFIEKSLLRRGSPERGDVVVFRFPERREQDFVKRVIAAPGDRLEVRDGHPWLNGWEVPHCGLGRATLTTADGAETGAVEVEFLGGQAYLTFYGPSAGDEVRGPFVAKEGEYWVLGDNRNASHDSRSWFGGRGGGVPQDDVRGRALFVWLSIGSAGVDGARSGLRIDRPTLPRELAALEPELRRCLATPPTTTTPPR